MICFLLAALLISSVGLAQKPTQANKPTSQNPVAIARRFLPPNSQLGKLYKITYTPHWTIKRWPAVLTAHIVAPDSRDIVFAYRTPSRNNVRRFGHLFVAFLHDTDDGYEEVYVASYQNEVLLAPRAIHILHLNGMDTDAVAVIHGIGAALGGRLDIYVWNDTWGLQNVFPLNGGTEYVYFFPRPEGFTIALTSFLAKRRGLDVSPPPVWYRWNGKRFVKILAPKGSSKWPIHDH